MNVTFDSDWASPPGDTILQVIAERGSSVASFCKKLGKTQDFCERLVSGEEPIDQTVAVSLSEVLGASPNFWLNRELDYRTDLARISSKANLENDLAWLKKFPTSYMEKSGWVKKLTDPTERAKEYLRFFDVANTNEWYSQHANHVGLASFRMSDAFADEIEPIAAWVRKGEIEAEKVDCDSWNSTKFADALQEIRPLTREKDPSVFLKKLCDICASAGVALVILKTPPGCPASGATKFVSDTKALILLSFRYLSDDHFWFTFFHEAGHLLLHGKDAFFLEGKRSDRCSKEENEANQFAENVLVPPQFQNELRALSHDKYSIIQFAKKVGVSPGIIVGQLQFKGLADYSSRYSGYKRRYKWVD